MIKKKDIKKETFVDADLKEIRKFKKHREMREQKNEAHESLLKTLAEQNYEPVMGTEFEFATSQVEESYHFDVPSTRHGPLSKFKGKKIRIV